VKRSAIFTALALLMIDPTAALAAVKGPGEDTPLNLPSPDSARELGTAPGAGGGSLVRTFLGLAVVVAVIYGLYWLLRQVKKSREERAHGTGLHVETTVPLGPNRSLNLVRVGRELVLVGVAEQGVVPIRTYTEEEADALGITPTEPPADTPRKGESDTTTPFVALQGRMRELVDGLRQRTVRDG
jgi:flagellar protein FliO/FliZ